MQLVGQGVQLQTEHKIIGPGGVLLNAARNNPASERFCAGFTTKYEELSAASGVYAQFRTLIDLVIAAAYVQREDLYRKSGFSPQALLEEKIVPVETCQPPKKVQAAVNVLWRGSRMIAPAGGGVSINAHLALEEDRLLADEDGQLDEQHESSSNLPAGRWWWD